jgi:metal-dependent amidase/aminoacylase/carboxypeptidase family protein
LGVNALYEASLALQAANSLRETFKDHEHIRFHPVITQSSGVVNAIPDNIILESFVRGANHDAIVRENKKINRAMAACAAAFGGNVILKDCPGYMPLKNSQAMSDIIFEAIGDAFGHDSITYGGWNTASTDMGDISQIMPVVHPYCSGASGSGHAANYVISDPETAVITSCKMQLVMINSLLSNGAVNALDVMKSFKPSFTKEQLLKALDDMFIELKAVTYNDDGTILLNF